MTWCVCRRPLCCVVFVAIAIGVLGDASLRAQEPDSIDASSPTTAVRTIKLAPTVHPAVPSRPTDFWYIPESFPRTGAGGSESPTEKFARAARLVDGGEFATALPLLTAADLSGTPLASYALYYRALALAGLN